MFRYLPFGILFCWLALAGCGDDPEQGGTTGECAVDADCPAALPICDGGRCVACEGAGCGGGVCDGPADCGDAMPLCEAGLCVGCEVDVNCTGRAGERCDRTTGACVECVDDSHCGEGRCADGSCVECLVGADCESGVCTAGICQQTAGCTEHEECGEGELCVFADRDAPFGSCAPACDPYAPAACGGEKRCEFVGFDGELRVVGACLPLRGGAGEQAPCDPERCETGLVCVNYGPGDERCTALCDPGGVGVACGADSTCDEIDLPAPEGATLGICLPTRSTCATDADCEGDEVCTVEFDAGDRLRQVCAAPVGEKSGGEPCADATECASGICLNGQQVCYGACISNAHCAGTTACVDVNFGSGQATACMPTCVDDASCGAGLACRAVASHDRTSLARVCSARIGDAPPGSRCSEGFECSTGICSHGFCYGLCDEDEDCFDSTTCAPTANRVTIGPDNRANTSDDVWETVGTCQGIPCTTDASCDPGWLCGLVPDPADTTASLVATRCIGPVGELAGGERCNGASQCASGLCIDPRLAPEDCDDGIDNDGDGDIDCDDLDCFDACNKEHDCGNGIDDDGDGAIDCEDGDCESACTYEGNCVDGIDNDGNGLTDCEDPDCAWFCGTVESDCTNGIDDDGDGLTDCRDPDCSSLTACRENFPAANCDDGLDNDGDGYFDCQDPDCRFTPPCNTIVHEGTGDPALCADGLDNDGDGLVDCADPGCAHVAPCTEASCDAGNCCANGIDDDGDGFRDCLDPDCENDPACNEAGRCDDRVDNDGDGLVDCHDPDCGSDPACNEAACTDGNCCADGVDNDGDGGIDCVDADCFFTAACDERFCPGGNCCADGIDNDGDGLLDCADPDCASDSSCREFSCGDGIDNDGDGLVDCDDRDCFSSAACSRRICFMACEVDADCPAGHACVPDAAWLTVDYSRENHGYASTCVPPAP